MTESKKMDELSLEKMNYDSINTLRKEVDDRLARHYELLNEAKKNSNGSNGYIAKSVGLVASIMIPVLGLSFSMIGNQIQAIREDVAISAVMDKESVKDRAATDAILKAEIQRIESLEDRIENFKRERDQIQKNRVSVARVEERLNAHEKPGKL